MNKKEKWANKVLQSLDGIQKAEPNPELFAKITQNLFYEKQVKIIPLKSIRWVGVAACLFLVVNIYVFNSSLKMQKNIASEIVKEISLITDYTLYR